MGPAAVTGALLAAGGFALVIGACAAGRRRRGTLCPGPVPAWWTAAAAVRWLRAGGCLYDLSGLGEIGGVTECPECGRCSRERERVHASGGWRVRRIGVVLAVAGVLIAGAPPLWSGAWVRYAPTVALASVERVLGHRAQRSVRRENSHRVESGGLGAVSRAVIIPRLISDLGGDDVPWNAQRAMELLESLGSAADGALEVALDSPDWQRRQLAAHLLRRRGRFEPMDALLRVSVEGLRADDLPLQAVAPGSPNGSRYTSVFNASEGLGYLTRHARLAEAHLARALDSDDPQQRFLAAAAAGLGGLGSLADAAAPILAEHLRDNDIPEDAKFAAAAFVGFGEAARPFLTALARDSMDAQERDLAALLVRHLDGRPVAPGLRALTQLTHDPDKLCRNLETYWLWRAFPSRRRSPQSASAGNMSPR